MTADKAGDRRTAALGGSSRTGSLRLVMLGAPGAGKGTQAERLARDRGLARIAPGDILRSAVASKSEIGRTVRSVMETGRLVSDELIIEIVKARIEEADRGQGFVLDGFPRTLVQAEALDHLLDGKSPLIVIDVEVPEDTLVARLSARRVCRACGTTATASETQCAKCGGALVQRRDDDPDVVRERLRVYERDTRPIVEFYRSRATFRSVDGDQPQDAVAADVSAAVASVVGARP
jgi:adenylate kinase